MKLYQNCVSISVSGEKGPVHSVGSTYVFPYFNELASIKIGSNLPGFFRMGQFTHAFYTEIAPLSSLPLIIDFHQDQTCQANDKFLIWNTPNTFVQRLTSLLRGSSEFVK
jgi:hypothetical protein